MSERKGGEARYPVRAVTARTGLTADVLRAWERRYGAVHPERSEGGQRLYSEQDLVRLVLLRRATQAGHSIGEVARLDRHALEALVEPASPPAALPPAEESVAMLVARAMGAIDRLDAPALDALLRRGALALGGTAFVDQVVSRLLRAVGDRWHDGTLSPAHEHLASVVIRGVLAWIIGTNAPSPHAPRVVIATPTGELHEFGAMLAAAAASEEGWRAVYLGANLPAADLAEAAAQVEARAVALSLVYAEVDAVRDHVLGIQEALPRGVTLLVGGAAVERDADALREAGVRVVADIAGMRVALRELMPAAHGAPPARAPSPS
jgi:DNA-binding transcriptional MerR regulator/methanogenic corrinoid protein MtbC1